MRWRKLGLVYVPDGNEPWARTHAALPTPLRLPGRDRVRIFVSCCDAGGVSRVGWVDVREDAPTVVVDRSHGPVLDIGVPGAFDENGAVCTSVVRVPDGRLFMYYVGFELGTQVRYRLLTGLAISDDDGLTFRRHSTTPILERSRGDLYFRCGTYVRLDPDGLFRMWYVGGNSWRDVGGKALPEYRVKYLESHDGIEWAPEGRTVIDMTDPDEHGFGRPWVMPADGGEEMYYSVRRTSLAAYRLGYATSPDGLRWDRRDAELGLDVTPGGFDSEAIMYTAVMRIGGRTLCYYNGDGFGRTGFGAAERIAP